MIKIKRKIGEIDLNEIILNSMKNSWSNKAYDKGVGYETITLKNI